MGTPLILSTPTSSASETLSTAFRMQQVAKRGEGGRGVARKGERERGGDRRKKERSVGMKR